MEVLEQRTKASCMRQGPSGIPARVALRLHIPHLQRPRHPVGVEARQRRRLQAKAMAACTAASAAACLDVAFVHSGVQFVVGAAHLWNVSEVSLR